MDALSPVPEATGRLTVAPSTMFATASTGMGERAPELVEKGGIAGLAVRSSVSGSTVAASLATGFVSVDVPMRSGTPLPPRRIGSVTRRGDGA